MTALIPIDFHSDRIFLIEEDGEPFVPMRPICDTLGLAWKPQFVKLTSDSRWKANHMVTQIPGDDQQREILCLPLRKLPAWLFSISPSRVKPELREKLIAYQTECDDVLWGHFMGEKKAMETELDHVRDAALRMRAHLLADRAYWNKIARYWDLGLGAYEISKLLRRPQSEVDAHHEEMRRCGVIASKILETGQWVDCTGALPDHAQDSRRQVTAETAALHSAGIV